MGRLTITNVSKGFKRYPRRRGRLLEWLGWPKQHSMHWALRSLSLSVEPGESVGLIGANGSGKSTLLKMIAGVTTPSSGQIEKQGRIAALLELGLGFHPEFSGRENVLIVGQLAGMTDAEIKACMPRIESFAGIGDAIDQPVRTYSSGMQVRLAFSVATAVRPDVLIVDEALAVGDMLFQQKCFDRIREFKAAGTTLFFVSHAMATVYALCDRVVLLDRGDLVFDGPPRQGIDLYNARVASAANQEQGAEQNKVLSIVDAQESSGPDQALPGSYSSGQAEIEEVSLYSADGKAVHALLADTVATLVIKVRFHSGLLDPHIGFQIRDTRGQPLFMTHTHAMGCSIGAVLAGDIVGVSFSFSALLAPGAYSVTIGVAEQGGPDGSVRFSLSRRQDILEFQVIPNPDSIKWQGVCNLLPSCTAIVKPAGGQ